MTFVGRLGLIQVYSPWRGGGVTSNTYATTMLTLIGAKSLIQTLTITLSQIYIYSPNLWQQTNCGVLVFDFWQKFQIIQWSALLNFKYLTVHIRSLCPQTNSFQSTFSATMSTIVKESARSNINAQPPYLSAANSELNEREVMVWKYCQAAAWQPALYARLTSS